MAIVTGVTPDGQILYTQHSDSLHDASLTERGNLFDLETGLNQIDIVRVNPAG